MKKDSFLFYPGDYMGGTLHFTLEQHGAYLLLLILQYNNGPFSEGQAMQMLGADFKNVWSVVGEKFVNNGELYWNERLQRELKKKFDTPFRRPMALDVVEYFEELGLNGRAKSEAFKFFNFYTSKGWKVGHSPMKDWRSAARGWKMRMDEAAKAPKVEVVSKTDQVLSSIDEAKKMNRD